VEVLFCREGIQQFFSFSISTFLSHTSPPRVYHLLKTMGKSAKKDEGSSWSQGKTAERGGKRKREDSHDSSDVGMQPDVTECLKQCRALDEKLSNLAISLLLYHQTAPKQVTSQKSAVFQYLSE